LGLTILSPVLFALAVLINKKDGDPVFYRGARVGRHGKLFRIFKFRTMLANAEKLGGPSTADDDPRITQIGKSLRKYKLDELPQLINVLKGVFYPFRLPNFIKSLKGLPIHCVFQTR